MTCCDHGYGRPSWRPRMSVPATYRLGAPRNQLLAVARWHSHLRGLATAIHAISGLDEDERDGGAKVWGEVQVLDVSSFFLSLGWKQATPTEPMIPGIDYEPTRE
jgi:hypothetical protein